MRKRKVLKRGRIEGEKSVIMSAARALMKAGVDVLVVPAGEGLLRLEWDKAQLP